MEDKKAILKQFQTLPSIGKAGALDLWNMGFRDIQALKNKNPRELYEQLNACTGQTHDICMLYTFRCVVYFVTESEHAPEKLNWWYWKNQLYNGG